MPTRDLDERGEGGDGFRRGPYVGYCVPVPGQGVCRVGMAAPDVDDVLAVDIDDYGGAKFIAGLELGFQFGFERGEAWVAVALDCHRGELGLLCCAVAQVVCLDLKGGWPTGVSRSSE